jgi:hypothetical protein
VFLGKSTKAGVAICLSCTVPLTIVACSDSQESDGSPGSYYIFRNEEMLKEFDAVLEAGREVLVRSMGENIAKTISVDARREYAGIIPEIPYIGGEKNENSTMQLVTTAQFLAIYRVLSENGKDIREIGQIVYDMFKASLNPSPKILVDIFGYLKFHVGWMEKIRGYAAMSQKHRYPMDFVYSFVEGDGKNLDYGVDMTECAIQKYLKTQNAEELVPYMCALDNALSIRFNRGLVRTKTLVESDVCDFRYKKNRKTEMPLPKGLKA